MRPSYVSNTARSDPVTGSGVLTYRILQRDEDFVTVKLEGELVGSTWTQRLHEFLEEHYVDDGVKRIRLDLADVEQLDEDGLGTLLHLRSEAIKQNKRLFIERSRGHVRTRLRVSSMLRKLERGE